AVEHARMRGAVRVVMDADAPACLASLAEAWHAHPEWLLVGSGGLSRHIAPVGARPRGVTGEGMLVVVAGSPTHVTATQLAVLPASSELIVLRTAPSLERDSGEAASALAEDVARLARWLRPRAVVLAGGATARAVCHGLGVHAVRLLGEVAPGIPI